LARTRADVPLAVELQKGVGYWRAFGPLGTTLTYLPLYAYLLGRHQNQPELAIQWLGFCHHIQHSKKNQFYLQEWPIVTDFHEAARAELGDEKFDALWEAGKELDMPSVYEAVIERFE
jgi:hypothetical protein